jgi:uncharacterized membrane protein YcjF (UPF0283 family)
MSMSLIATILVVITVVQLLERLGKGTAEIARIVNKEHERKRKECIARDIQWRRGQMTDEEKIADSARAEKWFAENKPAVHVYLGPIGDPISGEELRKLEEHRAWQNMRKAIPYKE